ncbi:hypothetical protein ACFS32_08710 [Novosphingobium pokkalii]|uniref:hypothetical protein n=1 Tax=Novosphingobium pokkalii TaxID=1770194 RepID=UPI00362DE184
MIEAQACRSCLVGLIFLDGSLGEIALDARSPLRIGDEALIGRLGRLDPRDVAEPVVRAGPADARAIRFGNKIDRRDIGEEMVS